jgi:hypothetical protein
MVKHMMKEQKIVSLKNRLVCYDCGLPINNPETIICPRCGSQDIDPRHSRPTIKTEQQKTPELPNPWTPLKLGYGGSVLLSGNAGSGKTTVCLGLNPERFCSSEQEVEKLKEDWWRIIGQHNNNAIVPLFSSINSWDELYEDLLGIEHGQRVVIDSISQLAESHSTIDIVRNVVGHIRYAGAFVWFIAQYTKDGNMLGPNSLRHLVDVVGEIPDDSLGMRRLAIHKNRYGSTFVSYFQISDLGVEQVTFDNVYTVEGPPGRYSLHLYPMASAKFTGIFDTLSEAGIQIHNCASAALACNLYASGFVEPNDAKFRREFAEKHGLLWITPKLANKIMEDSTAIPDNIKV